MNKFLTSVSSFQFYHVLRYAALVLTGIVFTKTSLTQMEIGQWETFLLLAGAVTFFWLNGLLKTLLLAASGEKENHRQSKAVFTAFVVISLFSILSAGFLLLTVPFFSGFLLHGNEVPMVPLLMVYIIFGIPANLVEYLYLLRKKYAMIACYGIITFAFQLLLVLIPAISGAGLERVVGGLVISMVIRYAWLIVILIRDYRIGFSTSFARSFLGLAWPLIVATLLSGSAQYIDSFIITSRFSQDVFAIFQYGARELPLAVLLANALSNSLLPSFSDRNGLSESLASLKANSRRLMHLLFPVTGVLLILSHPVFPILFNPAFAQSSTIFNIYLVLIISRLVFPQTILTGLQFTRQIMFASLAELIVNVAFSLLLVNLLGIAGVAVGTFIAYLFEKALLVRMVSKKTGIRAIEYIPLKLLGVYSASVISLFIFAEMFVRLWKF